MSHLSDTQFQELLDNKLNQRQYDLYLKHIRECPLCRQEWQIYQQLKRQLAKEPDIALSRTFTDNVLLALPANPFLSRLKKWIVGICIFLSLAGTGLIYFFRSTVSKTFISDVGFESPLEQFKSILLSIGDFILRIAGDQIGFFIIACLALILIGVLDKKIIQPRINRSVQLSNGIL